MQTKYIPIVLRLVLVFIIFACLAVAFLSYGAYNRPDLKFTLTEFKPDIPPETEKVMLSYQNNTREKQILFVHNRTFTEKYDLEKDIFTISMDCWVLSDEKNFIRSPISFVLDGRPQTYRIRMSEPSSVYWINLVPITMMAAYKDSIKLITYLVDKDLNIQYVSKTVVPFEKKYLGSMVKIDNTVILGELNTDEGHMYYLATGLGLCKSPGVSRDTNDFNTVSNQVDKISELGIVITPAHQPDWRAPWRIIKLSSSAIMTACSPFGWPSIFAITGGPANGWHTVLPDGYPTDSKYAKLLVDDDSWYSFYLLNPLNGHIYDRLRAGEREPDFHWPYNYQVSFSGHSKGNSATEFSILSWPVVKEGFRNEIYNSFTKSDTVNNKWWFEPEKAIKYDKWIKSITPIELSDNRIGFVLLNDDGSASFLLQDAFFKYQQIKWTQEPFQKSSQTVKLVDFLGVIPSQDKTDVLAFTDDHNGIIIFDIAGKVIYREPIRHHFLWNHLNYRVYPAVVQKSGVGTMSVVECVSSRDYKLCNLQSNPQWIQSWDTKSKVIWWALLLCWGIVSVLVVRQSKEGLFISESDLVQTVKSEKEAYEMLLCSMVVHEMGNFISAFQAYIQLDYRRINLVEEILNDTNPDIEKIREKLQKLKGREKYDQLINNAKEYLDSMGDIRLQNVDLIDVVERSLKFYRAILTRHDIEIEKDFQDIHVQVLGGTTLIFSTILGNAVDAIDERRAETDENYSGRIRIEVFKREHNLFITFQDNGRRIMSPAGKELPADQWERIFLSSFTTKKRDKKRGGLGLTMSREYAEREGWKLYVDNQTADGFTKRFVLEIPLME